MIPRAGCQKYTCTRAVLYWKQLGLRSSEISKLGVIGGTPARSDHPSTAYTPAPQEKYAATTPGA